mmetsp:Transcript_25834/g.48491  ORF Transcript_25834/g.48491 Transcript_25834/m.48491 type:complete len:338 (-) Transcript_25834:257-1270(-)|eukprot:CAMPEP_0114427864 /NCGR_PEP_ID=MMETSP0103-20121206/8601_1 /TAXON_ID=37642 ORGANISM="Paraphysomonas imperforata, Strain PA2" /NCGR_SAMPLE_ID=MMETSP0103 /ASSEMBLY_ACC=CAM_ASM_000201 /LENGTH=337 /DNA_ID=CAMNT_0001597005 /DNA_START=191 /DNA_END=1204 /DNA_ORIENTATION=+
MGTSVSDTSPPSTLQLLLSCPAVLVLMLGVNVVSLLIWRQGIDERRTSCSYNDIVVRKQWWKVLLAPCCHSSLLHAVLVSAALLSAAEAERSFGSIYFLKYSLVLVLAQAAVGLGVVHWLVTRHSSITRQYAPQLTTLRTQGATGLVFAWLGLLSFRRTAQPASLLGLVTVTFAYLPVMMMLVFQIAMPRSPLVTVDCTVGLLSGYALSLGLLEVLPAQSPYWTACFLLDVLLCCLHAAFSSSRNSSDSRVSSGSRERDSARNVDEESLLPLVGSIPDEPPAVVTMRDLQVQVLGPGEEEGTSADAGVGARELFSSEAGAEDDLERALRLSRAPQLR